MLKFFGTIGLVGTVVVFYLVTYGVGEERQLPPEVSLLEGFREKGFVPESASLEEDERAEEAGVFEVPAEDEAVLEAALEAMGDMDMGGMDMSGGDSGGMDMSAGGADEGMDMSGSDAGGMDMAEGGADEGMDMSGGDAGGMDMAAGGADEGMDMSGGDAGGMDMAAGMGEIEMGEGGLGFAEEASFDREIELTMTEWGFSEMQIDVKMGERIKFSVRNGGQIPHEFMFMNAPLMAAANYRGTRADWSLLEHEALFEQALVLPGGEFEFVLEVQQNGSWMFMCMLPYHMQMGMMGQMATEGAAMDMDM